MVKHWIGAIATLAALGLGPVEATAQQRPASVIVDAAVEEAVAETAPILGRLVASTRSVVAARTPGIVASVHVRVGDRVEAGAPLAQIDTERLVIDRDIAAAALARAEADLAASDADVRLAAQALDRIARLKGSGAFSQGAFDDRESERARADSRRGAFLAAVESARAALARADYNLETATIRAPFAGVVIGRAAQPGAYLSTGAAVATLIDTGDLEIEADIPAEFVAGLSFGLEVSVEIGRRSRFDATVRAAIPDEIVATRTRPVRFSFDATRLDASIAAGQSVVLRVPVAQPRTALTVSKDAVTQSPRGWMVFVAADDTAQPRIVEIGASVGDRLEILSGLAPGDLVVIRGNERLRPGQPIIPRMADETARRIGG